MKTKWSLGIYLCFLILPITSAAQNEPKIFTNEELVWMLENYHPVSIQGKLLLDKGESTVRKARGSFDPYLYTNLDQKYFDNKEYFSVLNGGLKVPTWYGIEINSGYSQNRGSFLNPENNLPEGGLWQAGISIPLGQGLFIDQRRATLRQAQIYAESTAVERTQIMNNLFYNALHQYWKWVESWNQQQVLEEAVVLAKTRFEGVRRTYLLGDIPAIDTLEAFIQVQNREIQLNEAKLNYQNTTLKLSNYLWFEENTPLEITDDLRPPSYQEIEMAKNVSEAGLQNLLSGLDSIHPFLQLYDYKLATLEIEERLKADKLKPRINLNYNSLIDPSNGSISNDYAFEDYKWGLELSFPIFLRKQRGDLQMTQIIIRDTELSQQQKLLELKNKVKGHYNEHIILKDQVALFDDAVNNYNNLLSGEIQKFNAGESSLFLINSREVNLIQARLKLIKLISEYNIAHTQLIWASGVLYQ